MTDIKFYIVLSIDTMDIYKPSLYQYGITLAFSEDESIVDDMIFMSLDNVETDNHVIIGFDRFGQVTENDNDIDISNFKFSFSDAFLNDNGIYMIYPDADIDKRIMDNLEAIYDLDVTDASEFCEKLSNEIRVIESNTELFEYFLESLGVCINEDNKSYLYGTMDYEKILQTMKNNNYNVIDADSYWLIWNK